MISKQWVLSMVCAAGMFIPSAAAFGQRLSGKVTVDGSSTVYPITEAVAEEFNKEHGRVRVTVGISGTGGGFKRFANGETDISDASRPIKKSEADPARSNGVEFIEIPVAYDGLTVVVNKQNTWAKTLTVDQLKKIFLEGGAKTWKDVDPSFPAEPIKVYAPGTDSGTFDYFKEVVVEKGSFRPDASVSEDDNVLVRGVAGDKGAIGFFGCAYYFENKDKINAVAVVNDAGKAILPNPQTIEDGSYNPLSRPLFIYVSKKSAERPEVDAFVKFYLQHTAKLSAEVGYVPLPQAVYTKARAKYEGRKTGSAYMVDGKEVKGPITKVY